MDEIKQQIIDDVKEASSAIDRASTRAKTAGLTENHRELESIWADIDVLFKKLCEQKGAVTRGS
jgi:hypothetical protein